MCASAILNQWVYCIVNVSKNFSKTRSWDVSTADDSEEIHDDKEEQENKFYTKKKSHVLIVFCIIFPLFI